MPTIVLMLVVHLGHLVGAERGDRVPVDAQVSVGEARLAVDCPRASECERLAG
jgi:hypothetical protein